MGTTLRPSILLTPVLIAGLAVLVAAADPPPPARVALPAKDSPPAKAEPPAKVTPPAKEAPPAKAPPAKEDSPDKAPPKAAPKAAPKAQPAEKDETAPLQVGKDLPGPFHPYNVTGPQKGRFHCLVSEHGLDPMVMIVQRSAEFSEPLEKLLQKLDSAIDKNPNVRLAAFAVFLVGELPEVVGSSDKTDDARNAVADKVSAEADKLKLKRVVLCLDSKADLEKYNLDEGDTVTVVLYNKLKVLDVFALTRDKFDDAAVERILAAVADKLGAVRR